MREGWQKASLGSLCKIYQPKTLTLKELDPNGGYDVFGANGIIGKHSQYNHTDIELLMGCRGSCGALNFSTRNSWINGNAMVIHPINDIVSKQYLKYFLESVDRRLIVSGTTIPQITAKSLAPLMVVFPSSNEQQRIVDVLDQEFAKIDALKANAEKSHQAAKDLFQATLKDALNCKSMETTSLLSLCQSIVDCPHSTPIKCSEKTNYPCIRTSELKDGKISWATMQYVSETEYKKRITRLQPQAGDIVYGREGTIGDAVLLPSGYHFCLGQRTMLFRPNLSLVEPDYLLYCILSPFVYNQAMSKNTGCGVAHVNVADVKQFRIPIPKRNEEQRRIVSRLNGLNEKCDTLQDNYQKTLTLCDYLKQSLLRKAFSGEL